MHFEEKKLQVKIGAGKCSGCRCKQKKIRILWYYHDDYCMMNSAALMFSVDTLMLKRLESLSTLPVCLHHAEKWRENTLCVLRTSWCSPPQMPERKWEKGLLCTLYSHPGICCKIMQIKIQELIPHTALKYKMKEMESGSQKCQCFLNELCYVTVS